MQAVVETCRRNKLRDGYIRLVVTRGVGIAGLESQYLQTPVGHHHRGQNPALSGGVLHSAAWRSSRCRRRATCTAR